MEFTSWLAPEPIAPGSGSMDFDDELRKSAAEGWDLVSVVPIKTGSTHGIYFVQHYD